MSLWQVLCTLSHIRTICAQFNCSLLLLFSAAVSLQCCGHVLHAQMIP